MISQPIRYVYGAWSCLFASELSALHTTAFFGHWRWTPSSFVVLTQFGQKPPVRLPLLHLSSDWVFTMVSGCSVPFELPASIWRLSSPWVPTERWRLISFPYSFYLLTGALTSEMGTSILSGFCRLELWLWLSVSGVSVVERWGSWHSGFEGMGWQHGGSSIVLGILSRSSTLNLLLQPSNVSINCPISWKPVASV